MIKEKKKRLTLHQNVYATLHRPSEQRAASNPKILKWRKAKQHQQSIATMFNHKSLTSSDNTLSFSQATTKTEMKKFNSDSDILQKMLK